MTRVVSIHSFRGGTGKSNTSANLSYQLAAAGRKVAVVDTDIQSPGIHVPLGATEPSGATLNDFLFGKASIEEVPLDVSAQQELGPGSLFLLPSSMDMLEITRVLKEGYDVGLLTRGFREIGDSLGLDYLVIDTHPGLNEETLLSIAISDVLIVIMRPDQQDFQGTSVTVEVARRLKMEQILILVNKALSHHDPKEIRSKVEAAYGCPVAAVLPLDEKVAELASAGLFSRLFPDENWSVGLRSLAERVISLEG